MTSKNMPKEKELMKQRKNAKGRVTRIVRKVTSLVSEESDDIEEMIQGLALLDDCYNRAEQTHEEYVVAHEDEDDDVHDEWINELFDNVCSARKVVRTHVRRLQDTKPSTTKVHVPETTASKQQQNNDEAAKEKATTNEIKETEQLSNDVDIQTADDVTSKQTDHVPAKDASEATEEASRETKEDQNEGNQSSQRKPTAPVIRYRLTLPFFCGALRDYRQFRTTFKTLVDPDDTDKNTKLHVLRGRLARIPERLICNIENYDDAWKKLDLTYGRTDQLTDVCFKEIEELKWVKKGDAYSFLKFAAIVQDIVTQLQNAGCKADLESTGLLKSVIRKLTDEDRERWGRDVREGHALETVRGLSNWLEKESIVKSQAYSLEPHKSEFTASVNLFQSKEYSACGIRLTD